MSAGLRVEVSGFILKPLSMQTHRHLPHTAVSVDCLGYKGGLLAIPPRLMGRGRVSLPLVLLLQQTPARAATPRLATPAPPRLAVSR